MNPISTAAQRHSMRLAPTSARHRELEDPYGPGMRYVDGEEVRVVVHLPFLWPVGPEIWDNIVRAYEEDGENARAGLAP